MKKRFAALLFALTLLLASCGTDLSQTGASESETPSDGTYTGTAASEDFANDPQTYSETYSDNMTETALPTESESSSSQTGGEEFEVSPTDFVYHYRSFGDRSDVCSYSDDWFLRSGKIYSNGRLSEGAELMKSGTKYNDLAAFKEYIEGDTVMERLQKGEDVSGYLPQVREMARKAHAAGLNIDYYPTNFVISDGLLWYIDYECNGYMNEWSFENWGVRYWTRTPELETVLKQQ